MQLISAGIFEMLEPLLPLEVDEEHTQLVSDVLVLMQSILPDQVKEEKPADILQSIEEEVIAVVKEVEAVETEKVQDEETKDVNVV